jgi:hypothetical protein
VRREMKRLIVLGYSLVLIIILANLSEAGDQKIKGKLIGEECAQQLKLGECFLEKAYPMVLFTEEGDYYRVELKGVDIVELDRAFGKRVELTGTVSDGEIKVKKIEILEPVNQQEFFKGCL